MNPDFAAGDLMIITDHINKIPALPGFALEVFLNRIIINSKCRIKVVKWPKVHSPYKRGGYGIGKAIKGNIHMAIQVLKSISLLEATAQVFKMLNLKV